MKTLLKFQSDVPQGERLPIRVTVMRDQTVVVDYVMDHNSPSQRAVLGEQVRNAFAGGQTVITRPL